MQRKMEMILTTMLTHNKSFGDIAKYDNFLYYHASKGAQRCCCNLEITVPLVRQKFLRCVVRQAGTNISINKVRRKKSAGLSNFQPNCIGFTYY
mmetsp:Transcript_52070/g.156243  ORF Transcript_52070/g.156243 Transcript_52070/m.156243 type:complete len:94 (+) Transcript_52070:1589-1870(+)